MLWRVVPPAPACHIQEVGVTVPVMVSKPVLSSGEVAVHTGADDVVDDVVEVDDVDDEDLVEDKELVMLVNVDDTEEDVVLDTEEKLVEVVWIELEEVDDGVTWVELLEIACEVDELVVVVVELVETELRDDEDKAEELADVEELTDVEVLDIDDSVDEELIRELNEVEELTGSELFKTYKLNRSPAPHIWALLPGQVMLHSDASVATLPVPNKFPQ